MYNCTFDNLLMKDPAILEIGLQDEQGQELGRDELKHMLELARGEYPGAVTVAGIDVAGELAQAVPVRTVYDLLHVLQKQPGKSRFLLHDANADLKIGKSVKMGKLGKYEQSETALRTVARALDIPFHQNVLQPETIYWDGGALNFITAKADATLKDLGPAIAGRENRGPLLVFLALQLIKGLAHVHASGNVLGDVSSSKIFVFKVHGVPELKVVPGKNTVPAATIELQDEIAKLAGRNATPKTLIIRDLDTVPCAYLEPGGRQISTSASDVFAAGSSLFEAVTGVPYGCGCDLPDYFDRLVRLEVLPPEVEPSTFLSYFNKEMAKPRGEEVRPSALQNLGDFAVPLIRFIRRMVLVSPDKRPSAYELLNDPVFKMRPHPRSGFPTFQELDRFAGKFKKMPLEARWQMVKEAAKQQQAPLATLPFPLKYLREQLVKGLINEFATKFGGLQPELVRALHQAVRLTEKMITVDTEHNEFARLMLANWDFALDVGSSLPLDLRKSMLKAILDYCAKDFKLLLNPEIIADTKAAILARHQAGLFLEQKEAGESSLDAQALLELVGEAASSQVYAAEQKKVKGRRVYIAQGPFASMSGTIERSVGFGSNEKLLVHLDRGDSVAVLKTNIYFE